MEDNDDEQNFEIGVDSKCHTDEQAREIRHYKLVDERHKGEPSKAMYLTHLCNRIPNSKMATPTIFVNAESTTFEGP